MIILLVDDAPLVRNIIIVNYLAGHNVIEANNGHEAQEKIFGSNSPIELVITDFKMPLMNGVELAKWIKNLHSNIPIILMSTVERRDYSPADIFLIKPTGFENFSTIIAKLFPQNNTKLALS